MATVDPIRSQARLWATQARGWITSGRQDDHARSSYAHCVSQARQYTRWANERARA